MDVPDFETIVTSYTDFAWRALARRGVPERDLPDACQEVFMAVHRNLSTFEGRSTLRTWIYGICRGVAGNYRNRAAHRYEVTTASPPEAPLESYGDAASFEYVARQQGLALLQSMLQTLPPEQREVFALYEIEAWTLDEIAHVTECARSTVYSRLKAARQALAELLKRRHAARRVA